MDSIVIAVVTTVAMLPFALLGMIAPQYLWELGVVFRRWQYDRAPEPSRALMIYYRVACALSLTTLVTLDVLLIIFR